MADCLVLWVLIALSTVCAVWIVCYCELLVTALRAATAKLLPGVACASLRELFAITLLQVGFHTSQNVSLA